MANEFLARNEEIVDGTYRLGPLIRRTVGSTVYETEFGEQALPAAIKIREVESMAAETPYSSELSHPNLLKIYATGSSVLNNAPVVYIVMERADESLQRVVAERALTRSETREMLVPLLDALEYLHKKGYAHSSLKASNVLALNNQLKLSSDGVIRVDDGGSPAEDMRALGALITEVLTGAEIPQPLADIVRHCLDPDPGTRWTVEQVKARLTAPALEAVPSLRKMPVETVSRSEGIPKWIYAGLAALVLIVALAAMVRKKDPARDAVVPVAAAARQDPPSEAPPSPRVKAAPPVAQTRGRKANGWSVIVGAYGAHEPAEKRMRAMMKKWPNFKISLSEPQAEKTRYLVVLGQNLSEDQAEALRKRAIDSGLPHDTYIKRVM
jgi:hypothetical protein